MAGLHRTRVADPRRHRPRGLHRGVHVRRGARARPVRPRRGAHRRARGQGHPAPGRLPVCRAAASRDGAAVPGEGGRPPGRLVRGLRHDAPPGGAPRARPGDRARAASAAPAFSTSRRACWPCRPRRPSGSATTWSSPTASTTRCAGLRLADGSLTLLAGTGRQLRERSGSGPALEAGPLDAVGRRVVHRPRRHRDGRHPPALGAAPGRRPGATARWRSWAGPPPRASATEPADEAWFAQPSGLAVSADGRRLWVADSETSALRSLDLTDEGFVVETHVGQGLFDFGHRDGPAEQALLQHPLGVTVLPDGSVAVSDTYNGAVRRFDPVARRGVDPGHRARASPATRSSRPTTTAPASWSWSRRPTSWSESRCRRRPSGSTAWPARRSGRARRSPPAPSASA